MATLSEYFDSEARDCLAQLNRDLERPAADLTALHRAVRTLRGSAQMAREERVVRAALALESALRAAVEHALSWSDELTAHARASVADLRLLVERREAAAALDAAADAVVGRWRDVGVSVSTLHARPVAEHASASREFRAFVAREVAGIAEALDRGVQQLMTAPMDREPLKMILRRQRALLGAARLDEVPVIAEILRAIDDLTRVIAKLDVGVKREWLDIYRVAREGLKAAIEPLQRDQNPPSSHSLSRLRHMRAELLERYGTGEAVSAAHETQGFTQATTVNAAPDVISPRPDENTAEIHPAPLAPLASETNQDELLLDDEVVAATDIVDTGELLLTEDMIVAATTDGVPDGSVLLLTEADVIAEATTEAAAEVAADDAVPIETLLYQREAALRRALELYAVVARAGAADPAAQDAIEEVFDLINIALR